jgi:uncharacterized protein (DUF1330 family)
MPAYVIVDVEIHDPERYEEYKRLTPASIHAYDGKFVVRGGRCESLEADWKPQRVVVLEFPTLERAKEWWNSPEYAPAKALRHATANSRMLVVEGVG